MGGVTVESSRELPDENEVDTMRHNRSRVGRASRLVLVVSGVISVLAAGMSTGPAAADGGRGRGHEQIVFTRQLDGGGSHVHTVGANGVGERLLPLPLTAEDFNRSVWSHRGRELLHSNIPYTDPASGAFVGFRPAFSAADGSGFRILVLPDRPEDMSCTAWTPDDRRIVCGDDTPGLFSMRVADGGDVRRLTHNPFGGQDMAVGFSPDGSRLALLRERPDPGGGPGAVALYVCRPDGSQLRQLTPFGLLFGFTLFAGASWSPDGRHLVSSTGAGDLVFVRSDGEGIRTQSISVGGEHGFVTLPDYAPDGHHLVFSMFLDADADLYRADISGRHVRRLTDDPANDINADWNSPSRHR